MAATQQTEFVKTEIRRMTGRHYPNLEASIENLSPEAQAELVRFIRDIQGEMTTAQRRAAREPWRHW